jgi:hypothetical protein
VWHQALQATNRACRCWGIWKTSSPEPLPIEKLLPKITINVQRCLSSPNNCCHVVEDEDNNFLPQYWQTPSYVYILLNLLVGRITKIERTKGGIRW